MNVAVNILNIAELLDEIQIAGLPVTFHNEPKSAVVKIGNVDLSIAVGVGNYCSNKMFSIGHRDSDFGDELFANTHNAELYGWFNNGVRADVPEFERDVMGWVSIDEIIEVITNIAGREEVPLGGIFLPDANRFDQEPQPTVTRTITRTRLKVRVRYEE